MRRWAYFLNYWLPVLIWMGFIFSLSSQSKVSVTQTFVYDFMIFKTLHMIEYAILYFLLFRGFYSIKNKNFSLVLKFILPMIIGFLYSLSDELHQLYVPTRSGQWRDTGIDLLGIVLMYTFIKKYFRFFKRYL
jgi:VanZ family protein